MQAYIQKASLDRMQKYFPKLTVSMVPTLVDPEKILAEKMSLILIWGPTGSILLKTYFQIEDAKFLASGNLGIAIETVEVGLATSTMREFSNLQGGFFRGAMEGFNVLLGMSLPFLLDAADETVFCGIRKAQVYTFYWSLNVGEKTIPMSVDLEISEPTIFEEIIDGLDKNLEIEMIKKAEDNGDIEFL